MAAQIGKGLNPLTSTETAYSPPLPGWRTADAGISREKLPSPALGRGRDFLVPTALGRGLY
jgi:hypothetical protein